MGSVQRINIEQDKVVVNSKELYWLKDKKKTEINPKRENIGKGSFCFEWQYNHCPSRTTLVSR